MAKLFDDDELYFEKYKKTSNRDRKFKQTRQNASSSAGKKKQTNGVV